MSIKLDTPGKMVVGWATDTLSDLERDEQAFGMQTGIVSAFRDFVVHKDFPAEHAEAAIERGVPLMVWWEPWDASKPHDQQAPFAARVIAAGGQDEHIIKWFQDAQEYATKTQVWAVYAPEFNELSFAWAPGTPTTGYATSTPAEFIAMWRHVAALRDEHAPDVKLLWNPLNYSSTVEFEHLYPGHAYVDALGLNGFNWSDAHPALAHRWQPAADVFGFYEDPVPPGAAVPRLKALAAAGNKPWGFTSVASAPDNPRDFQPGGQYYDTFGDWVFEYPQNPPYEKTAADWITQEGWTRIMLQQAIDNGATFWQYFHFNKETDWRLTDTAVGRSLMAEAKTRNSNIITGREIASLPDVWRFGFSLSTTAGPLTILDGSFTFDRGWSPMGQGSFTVPLDEWEALGLDPLDRHRVVIRSNAANYGVTGSLGDPEPAGTLGTTSWPDVRPAPYGLEEPLAASVGWQVFVQSVSVDRQTQTAELEVATFEAVLAEIVNMGDPWLPVGFVQIGYAAGDALVQMLRYAGVSTPVEESGGVIIPFDKMAPWQPGETAWDWWDRVRVAGELGYTIDPTTGILSVATAQTFTGQAPLAVMEHTEQYGVSLSEAASYADALTVMWAWTETEGGDLVERSQREVAYATGLTDWRQSRRHKLLERVGPPVPGYAQRAVDNLNRFRVVHEATVPLTPALMASAPGREYQAITFNFTENPTASLTILTN